MSLTAESLGLSIAPDILKVVAEHIALPPKLPQEAPDDACVGGIESAICALVVASARSYAAALPSHERPFWTKMARALEVLQLCAGSAQLDQALVMQELQAMDEDDVLAFPIRAQNAAVIARRTSTHVVFESFEVQPKTEDIMACTGKLCRVFPDTAVQVPIVTAQEAGFFNQVSTLLSSLDFEQFEDAWEFSTKAGTQQREIRNSNHPKYVTEFFAGIMRGYGEVVSVKMIKKRTADEVLWKSAEKPWRRSPVYLIIRVMLQSSVANPVDYKMFMLHMHTICLSLAALPDFDGELLYALRAKMARRLDKLRGQQLPESLARNALEVATRVQNLLLSRWDEIQQEDRLHLQAEWAPHKLDMKQDLAQTLPHSGAYLRQILEPEVPAQQASTFEPTSPPRLRSSNFNDYANDGLEKEVTHNGPLALFDFEKVVRENLDAWVEDSIEDKSYVSACDTLMSCVLQYYAAGQRYVDVADKSIFVLTIVDLWKALDRVAIADIPMLADYSPEIPRDFLHPLLLHSRECIEQANTIERYIWGRHSSVSDGRSVFSDNVNSAAFSIRFFGGSSSLRQLQTKIEAVAQQERDAKVAELEEKNAHYRQLVSDASELTHEYEWDRWTGGYTDHNKYSCQKCCVQRSAEEVCKTGIHVHEWPLPPSYYEAQRAVFELAAPHTFQLWRTATFMIMNDVGRPSLRTPDQQVQLLRYYEPLTSYLDIHGYNRVSIASDHKPFLQTEYGHREIPASTNEICVPNGLRFRLYDERKRRWASGPFHSSGLSSYGTLQLPEGPYKYLQYSVDSTMHTTNKVIAERSYCPEELSLHEHEAFGSLRSGGLLQWLNILRELEDCALSFRCEAVYILVNQAAWQIGPLSGTMTLRTWHEDIETAQYSERLIRACHAVLRRIQDNWLESVTLRLTVLLVLRLLVSLPLGEHNVRQDGFAFLRSARHVALQWMQILQASLREKIESEDSSLYAGLVCEMAMTCRMTFDVDSKDLSHVMQLPEDISGLILCAIALHDNRPPHIHQAPLHLQSMMYRDQRLAHKIQRPLLDGDRLLLTWDGFDLAIKHIWPAYRPSPSRAILHERRWMHVKVVLANSQSQRVDYDVVDGSLLIDGKPIRRLPREYVTHPTYLRTFGSAIMDVIPGTEGMEYTTPCAVRSEYAFAFSLRGNFLQIQAVSDDDIFELVPHNELRSDFPSMLVEEYTHWMHLGSRTMEFRPHEQQWTSSDENWRLHMDLQLISRTYRGRQDYLIDYHSGTSRMIAHRLSRLEPATHVLLFRSDGHQVVAILPRLRLRFSVDGHQLSCDTFPKTVVDDNQSCGTLIGLRNRLVLRSTIDTNHDMRLSRSVLVTHGAFNIQRGTHHVDVLTDTSKLQAVSYSKFDIDEELGRLSGEANLTDRLLKIYLHVITSYCLPDPLLKRMGVEQALLELSSGAVHSFTRLESPELRILALIGTVTPRRVFYPAHLQCMESVEWLPISVFAQHFAFAPMVKNLLSYARVQGIFSTLSESTMTQLLELVQEMDNDRNETLLRRAGGRSATYYPAGLVFGRKGNHPSCSVTDLDLRGRGVNAGDVSTSDSDVSVVAQAVRLVRLQHNGAESNLKQDLLDAFGPSVSSSARTMELGYSREWYSPKLSTHWLRMFDLARHSHQDGMSGHHALVFSLATLSYRSVSLRPMIPVLAAIAHNHTMRRTHPPQWTSYDLSQGFERVHSRVETMIRELALSTGSTPAGQLSARLHESGRDFSNRQQNMHREGINSRAPEFARYLMAQHVPLLAPGSDYSSWFAVQACLQSATNYFNHCAHNMALQQHLDEVEQILRSSATPQIESSILRIQNSAFDLIHPSVREETFRLQSVMYRGLCDLRSLSSTCSASFSPIADQLQCDRFFKEAQLPAHESSHPVCNLESLIEEFSTSADSIRSLYGSDLRQSHLALQQRPTTTPLILQARSTASDALSTALCAASVRYWIAWQNQLQQLSQASIHQSSTEELVLVTSGLMPRHSLPDFMRVLREDASCRGIMLLARLFVLYQQLERMRKLVANWKPEDLIKEYTSWTLESTESADDVLLQIDADFRIRKHQFAIAQEMITPCSGQNTTKQLNMGEGKSSVIVPMTLCALADGVKLVRVVVLKSLSAQMFHLLVSRISGLLNRRVYFLPFSRQANLSGSNLDTITSLLRQCALEGGVLLVQPEHILSLKLLTQDVRLSSAENPSRIRTADQLEEIDEWLRTSSRDVLDESDELFDVRYQLIYTMGAQRHLDNSPDRWTTTQQVLNVVSAIFSELHSTYEDVVYYRDRGNGAFPEIRLLQTSQMVSVAKLLKQQIAEAVLAGDLQNINLRHISSESCEDRDLVVQFLTERDVPAATAERVRQLCAGVWKGVLLVRGLLAFDVLLHVLADKRFRVNYGLDLKRSLLAVPYAAKDVPTLRSEFSHPDVAVALTTLSYYYAGLNAQQMSVCFDELVKTDDPELEYSTWVQRRSRSSTPVSLQTLNGVNTKDAAQFDRDVLPAFQYNHSTIDFYLGRVVFPKEAKEFPLKLSTSGWDLAERKTHVSTGFSGTNDRKYLLPTSVKQRDQPEQLGTNAMVLEYLLQDENRGYQSMCNSNGMVLSTAEFLQVINEQTPTIRVLLDVGAQMLDMKNKELVEHWLELARPQGVSAAVYFNDLDELTVLSDDGVVESFQSSPHRHSMDKVIVYLDDAHTRGTDLKLPLGTRAAVTLGPKVTKDRLVQGCMRLRQLGHGQSVMFFAPPDCNARIRDARIGSPSPVVDSRDVLRWVMQQTCDEIRHYVPHWVQQGLEYARHAEGRSQYLLDHDVASLRKACVGQEGRGLEDMYGLERANEDLVTRAAQGNTSMDVRLKLLGIATLHGPHLDEEQEREISHEVEQQRQVERPPNVKPITPSVHPDVRTFITKGVIPEGSSQFQSLMLPISITGENEQAWSPTLYGTTEFFRAVDASETENLTTYARATRWIVSADAGRSEKLLVAMSPYEVNELLPLIRKSFAVHLHVYAPRVIQSMRSFSDLTFHVIPSLKLGWRRPSSGMLSQLDLFAGQLYLDSWSRYIGLTTFLGISSPESKRIFGTSAASGDGFIPPSRRTTASDYGKELEQFGVTQSFGVTPVQALLEHIGMRRNGMDFIKTHLGQILHGRHLKNEDF